MIATFLFRIIAVWLALLPFVRIVAVGGEAGKAKTTALVVAGGGSLAVIGGATLLAKGTWIGAKIGEIIFGSPKPIPPKPTVTTKKPPEVEPSGAQPQMTKEPQLSPDMENVIKESLQRMDWKAALSEALQREEVLLYDSAGNAVVKRNRAWDLANKEFRESVERILEDALEKAKPVPKDKRGLKKVLAGILVIQLVDFDTKTGKLTLTFNTTFGEVSGHVNVYDLIDQIQEPPPLKTAQTVDREDPKDREENPADKQ